MSDFVTTSIPLIGRLTNILTWLLFINTLLVGGVILQAYRAIGLRRRIEELEEQLNGKRAGVAANEPTQFYTAIEDDRPIPLAKHRFGDASKILKRPHRTERQIQ